MPSSPLRLSLLQLGGEDAFERYHARFRELYHSDPIHDVLGRQVEFPPHSCRHVCFKTEHEDSYGKEKRAVWNQARAERIEWILQALLNPQEIRPSHQRDDHQAYFLGVCVVRLETPDRLERFGVYVSATPKATVVTFLSAYPMEEPYWRKTREAGPAIYPPPAPKAPKKKRRK